MTLVPLNGGFYKARALLANAQSCINLYPEINPPDSTVRYSTYPTPGLLALGIPPALGAGRCLYRTSTGEVYAVVAQNVYHVSDTWNFGVSIGTIVGPPNPCFMADNGQNILLVDGTPNGYSINLATDAFAAIVDPDFFGGDRVDYLDQRFVLNKPGTSIFYYSLPLSLTFDPLDFAAKAGYPDHLVTLIVLRRDLEVAVRIESDTNYTANGNRRRTTNVETSESR